MKRNQARQIAVRLCYSFNFEACDIYETTESFFSEEHYNSLAAEDELFAEFPDEKQLSYIKALVIGVAENSVFLDNKLQEYSNGWKIERLSKTALAVLRCAVYEMLYMDDIDISVSINEAVEISKLFDTEETTAYINGVLGSIARSLG